MMRPLWKASWQFLTKLNIVLPEDPAITLPGSHSADVKIYEPTKPCVEALMAALLIIAKSWTQPRKMSFSR